MKILVMIQLGCVFSFLSIAAYPQVKNDLTKECLRGRVKTLDDREYQGAHKKKEIVAGRLYFLNSSKYSIDGFYIEKKLYGEKDFLSKDTFVYSKGMLIQKNHSNNYGHMESQTTYDYDDRLNLVKRKYHYLSNPILSDTVFYKYDENGNQIEEYFAKTKLRSKNIYDKMNNEIETSMYNSSDSLVLKELIKYDSRNNKIEDIGYHDSIFEKYIFKYDGRGNVIEECYYKEGDLIDKKTFKYSNYDMVGNWLRKITFYFDELNYVNIRQVEYY